MSGWVTRLDFNGDGKQDFWGRPGGFVMSARYVNDSTGGSFMPHFARKENGCVGYCAFADFPGGGNLEVVNGRRVVSNMRSEEHTSQLQSLMRNSYAVFCCKKKNELQHTHQHVHEH